MGLPLQEVRYIPRQPTELSFVLTLFPSLSIFSSFILSPTATFISLSCPTPFIAIFVSH